MTSPNVVNEFRLTYYTGYYFCRLSATSYQKKFVTPA